MSQSIQSPGKISFSIAFIVFLLYYSILFTFPNYLLNDPDTFWHIRVGQWILDHAQFPTVDFFSYTAAGKPWISTEWLSDVFFAVAFKFGGWQAVVFFGRHSLFGSRWDIVLLPGATPSIFGGNRLDCINGNSN